MFLLKRGRRRPKGSKNKTALNFHIYNLPFEKPTSEEERIANIAYMVSFYQHSDGRSKGFYQQKKRGRKPKLDLMDDDNLLKGIWI